MRKLSLPLFVLFLIISCGDKDKGPKGILPEEKMRDVLWSMLSAGEFLNRYILNKDSVDKMAESSKVYGQVFQIHHITKEEFDKSYYYYRDHPDLMKVILDSLSKKQTYTVDKVQQKQDSARQKVLMKEK